MTLWTCARDHEAHSRACGCVQAATRCDSCDIYTEGQNYCGRCGTKKPKPFAWRPTATAFIIRTDRRLRQLQEVATDTGKTKDRYVIRLLQFTNLLRECDSIYQLRPDDVVRFLVSLDDTSATRVHRPDCPQRGNTRNKAIECGCPRRAKASSVKTARKNLSRGLADEGLLVDWSAQTLTGNPVQSRAVRDYEAAVNREQLMADVRVLQAPIFDETVFSALMNTVIDTTEGHILARDYRTALDCITDAFLYSFMYYTGDRLQDALFREWNRIEVTRHKGRAGQATAPIPSSGKSRLPTTQASPRNGIVWFIRRGVSKTSQTLDDAKTHTLADDPHNRFHPIQLAELLDAASRRLALPTRTGRLFKKLKPGNKAKAIWGFELTTSAASKRLTAWLQKAAALPQTLTAHSFHPSHAVMRLDAGHDVEDIVDSMAWSQNMLWKYLDQPILTMGGPPRPNATASFKRPTREAWANSITHSTRE
jgi:integrase